VKTISRRTLIHNALVVGGVAFLAPGAESTRAFFSPKNPKQSTIPMSAQGLSVGGRTVSLVAASDDSFASQMGSQFHDLQSDRQFQSIGHVAALLTNVNGPTIRAISCTWDITTPNGVFRQRRLHYSPASPRALITAQRPFLVKSSTRLLTPFLTWSVDRARITTNWTKVLGQKTWQVNLLQQIKQATSVAVRIDSILYNDWTAIGTDDGNLAKHIAAKRNADRDEAVSVLQLMDGDPDPGQIAGLLKQHKSIQGFGLTSVPTTNTSDYWYWNARTKQANALLWRFKHVDRALFLDDLRVLRDRASITIQPAV
jgi:hypothetical protein